MDGERLIILAAELDDFFELLCVGVEPRLIHQTERDTRRAVAQVIFEDAEHFLLLLRRELSVFISRNRRARRAMTHERCDIAGHISVYSGVEFFYRAVFPGSAVEEEKTAAYLVFIGRIIVKADGGKTAVPGHECGYALADKRLEIFERLRLYGEPVIVGMGIDKAGGKRPAFEVDNAVGAALVNIAHFNYSVSLEQYAAVHGVAARSVIDPAVFK